jgi:NAD(P)-dependent dehydrogenase (short-subunit alcohol dehydrogenase family)
VALDGKTVFITGGARGIGLGIALSAAKQGARVAIADIAPDALERARAQLEGTAEVRTYVVDVTDRTGMAAMADRVNQELGPVYGLFNNAGIVDSVPVAKMRGEVWDWIINVNLNGVYNGLQAFLPDMIRRKQGGFVVNTSSMAGMGGFLVNASSTAGKSGSSSGFAYSAAKFGVVGLSEALREEVAHHGIGVSVAVPGEVATSIIQNTRDRRPSNAEQHSERVTAVLDSAHMSLLVRGTPLEVAGQRIVEGAIANRPYIFTDNLARDIIRHRTDRVLASFAACFP